MSKPRFDAQGRELTALEWAFVDALKLLDLTYVWRFYNRYATETKRRPLTFHESKVLRLSAAELRRRGALEP